MKTTEIFSTIASVNLIFMSLLLGVMVTIYFVTLLKEIKGYVKWKSFKNEFIIQKNNLKQFRFRI